MAQLLDSVQYFLVLEEGGSQAQQAQQAQQQGEHAASGSGGSSDLQAAVAASLAAPDFLVERQAKKGGGRGGRGKKKAAAPVDLRWALQELETVPASKALAAGVAAEVLAPAGAAPDGTPPPRKHVLRLRTACANGNPVLTPAMALDMINRAAAVPAAPGSSSDDASSVGSVAAGDAAAAPAGAYALAHIHRADIRLRPMSVPQPDHLKLRSLCRYVGLSLCEVELLAWVSSSSGQACTPASPPMPDVCSRPLCPASPPMPSRAPPPAPPRHAAWRATWRWHRRGAVAPGARAWRTGPTWSESCSQAAGQLHAAPAWSRRSTRLLWPPAHQLCAIGAAGNVPSLPVRCCNAVLAPRALCACLCRRSQGGRVQRAWAGSVGVAGPPVPVMGVRSRENQERG